MRAQFLNIPSVRVVKDDHMHENVPLFPQPVDGQFDAVSPERHAPFQSWPPSEPDHCEHDTSVNVPVSAPWPEGKNCAEPPVSSQISKLCPSSAHSPDHQLNKNTHWNGISCSFVGLLVVWPQNSWLPCTGHKSVTFTTIVWPNGPL